MAYNNGFSGDVRALGHILQTLEAKTYAIPGITVNPSLHYTSGGEVAYLYTRSAGTAEFNQVQGTDTVSKAGDKVEYGVRGHKRIDISLTDRISIGAILPYVNVANVSPDAVADKVVQETIQEANIYNEKFLAALVSGGTAKTYSKGAGAFKALAEGISKFKKDNAVSGLAPTGIIASSDFFLDLITDNRINLAIVLDQKVAPGQVRVLNLPGIPVPVIEAPDLSGVDFIVLNAEGCAAPLAPKTLEVVSAVSVGFPGGTLVAGELPFAFKVLTKDDDATLDQTGGYLVAKYTEAKS